MAEVYLDNSATTRAHPEVIAAMQQALAVTYGNPSSLHRMGLAAERLLKEARVQLAAALGVPAARLIFTSGGTEANNLALFGLAGTRRAPGGHIVTTAIEHASVLEPCRRLRERGFDVTVLPVAADGRVDPDAVAAALREDTLLVSVMHVNNEIGTVQPVAEIAKCVRAARGSRAFPRFHVDAVQSFCKLPLKPTEWGIDLVTVSAHKLHGPKGVGALYVADGVRLEPLLFGGEQEQGLRPGTENVAGIVGFGRAVALWVERGEALAARLAGLRQRLVDGLVRQFPEARINGPAEAGQAAPHIVNVSFPDLRGETLVHALADRDIYVSTGSACHSRKAIRSHVIEAIGVPHRYRDGAIRISLSPDNTEADIDRLLEALAATVPMLQALAVRR